MSGAVGAAGGLTASEPGRSGRLRGLGWLAMVAALAAVAAVALRWGSVPVSWSDVADAVAGGVAGRPLEGPAAIVWQLRVPRVLAGLVAGAALGISGAALQGIFRNPLADPYLMGAASGALFGATVCMAAGRGLPQAFTGLMPAAGPGYLVPAGAFAGALGAVFAAVVLARASGGRRATDLVLAGVVVGSVLTAATTYLMMRDADRVRAVFSWSLGNLATAGWAQLRLALPGAALGSSLLLLAGRPLDAVQMGEDVAASLGLPIGLLQSGVIAAASLATASVVAQVGIIGFVGLVVPHILRRLVGGGYRRLLPGSALGGALLLALADLGARVAVRPAELPVGVVTTLLGGPFFLYLLRRGRGHAEP